MANERSELILRVDDLTHKVLRCESEVAVGETFDLVFFGGRVWDGDSAKVFLYDDKERLLWSASGVVEARSDGTFVISGCVIDTEQAAAYANRGDKRGRRVYGELIRVDVEGERTDYGDFSFLLHKGVSADGTPLVKFLDNLSAHNVDSEAHEDIRQEIAQVETSILASVSQDLEAHAVIEETARNEAIHRAMIDLRSEFDGGADGIGAGAVAEATRQAALAGEIAVGVADSARAAAVSAETAAQAAKDGASYLNLIINASKSALASKDQAQAFATSSSEAKDAAEASVASVNSDRVAVEAARDEVIEARNDVIAAQGAVGGLLSSARESEAAARESASTASRVASDAESAKSDAESARERAVVARDEAEAFAAGAARSAEASEASAVRAEKAAAQSAQEAAENVTALLQGKVDAAEAAKAGAEAAKKAAETAKTGADAANAAAASSATAAANSAAAAAQSATDLADAVATADSLDGRIRTIESGNNLGFSTDGKFQAYSGLAYGDGSFKVIKDLPNVKRVGIKEFPDTQWAQCYDDGIYAYVALNQSIYQSHKLFIFNNKLEKIVDPIDNGAINTTLEPSKAYYHADNERIYGAESLYNTKVRLGCIDKTSKLIKRVYTSIPCPKAGNGNGDCCVVYNKRSGNIVVFHIEDDHQGTHTLWNQAFDLELNPILEDDGSERIYSRVNDVTRDVSIECVFSVKYIEDALFLVENGGMKSNGRIFTLNERDELLTLHEGIAQTGEDGNMLCETREVVDEEGNTTIEYVLDAPERNKMVRPILAQGGEYRFNTPVNDDRFPKLTSGGAYRTNPSFSYVYGIYFMEDGVDCYVILKSGEIVNAMLLPDDWTSGKHGVLPPITKLDRGNAFTKKNMYPRFSISSGIHNNTMNLTLTYDSSTGNELSAWRRTEKLLYIFVVGTNILQCLPLTLGKPSAKQCASPFGAEWLLFGSLWFSTASMAFDNSLR